MRPIQTERLILREFNSSDYEFVIELLNSKGWLKFIGDRNIKTKEEAELYINEILINSYKNLGYGLYHVSLKNGHSVGMCGLVKRDFLNIPDIGFALLPQYEGLGYAYEASKAILNSAKTELGLTHLLAVVNENNSKSISLLHKLGLFFEKKVLINHKELDLFSSQSHS